MVLPNVTFAGTIQLPKTGQTTCWIKMAILYLARELVRMGKFRQVLHGLIPDLLITETTQLQITLLVLCGQKMPIQQEIIWTGRRRLTM